MTDHKRPGGLTALAVLNFVFGGLGAIGLIGLFGLLSMADGVATAAGGSLTAAPGAGGVYLSLALGAVATVLLIASGVGYLQMKKFLGQKLGNGYAVVAIANTVIGIIMLKSGFGVFAIIGLIYPVITLALLNTTFKDDFVN